jgi:hypothetical protein
MIKSKGYKKLTDIDIIVRDKTYRLHRYVLQDAEYFYNLFVEFPEKNIFNICVPEGMTNDIFENMIEYLYDKVGGERNYEKLNMIFKDDDNIDKYKYIRYFGILDKEEEDEFLEKLMDEYIIYYNKNMVDVLKIGIEYDSNKIIKSFFEMNIVYWNLKENTKMLPIGFDIKFDKIGYNIYDMKVTNGVNIVEERVYISDDRIEKIKFYLNYYRKT